MAFGAIQQEISRQWGEMGAEDKEEFENQVRVHSADVVDGLFY